MKNLKSYHNNFNEQKTINAVLYVINKLKRKDFHKIFKILYFADREHIAKYARPITGDTYIAMGDGPVPSKLYDILKSVRGDSYFKDDGKFSKLFKIVSWDLVKPLQKPNLNTLSKTDIEHLDNALELYGDMSWDEVREKSHDYAWRNTIKNTPISLENIVRETGSDSEYLNYIKEQNQLIQLCK